MLVTYVGRAVLANEVFRFLVVSQQAVNQFVRCGHVSSFLKVGSFLPNNRLHKTSYTLCAYDLKLPHHA
jgi:hypothetical protein